MLSEVCEHTSGKPDNIRKDLANEADEADDEGDEASDDEDMANWDFHFEEGDLQTASVGDGLHAKVWARASGQPQGTHKRVS